jgi:hypothetical protein
VSHLKSFESTISKGLVLTYILFVILKTHTINVTDADRVQTNALMSVAEVAAGTKYSTSITTGWRPPAHIRSMTDEQAAALRKKWYIIAEGQDIPPPIKTFTVSSVFLDKMSNAASNQ